MLDNVGIRSAIVAWLRANSIIVSTLDDSDEIREKDWQGEDFSYPNIRVTCSSVPSQCSYSDVSATISYFSEQKSSREALFGQGVIYKQLQLKSVTKNYVRMNNIRVTNLPDAVQEGGVWKADVVISFRATPFGFYFEDLFNRSDGSLGNGWISPKWVIQDNKAINTPSLGSELWDAAAAVFTAGTYAWVKYANNLMVNDANELKVTYVDNVNGAYNYLRDANDLSADLAVGEWYQLLCNTRGNTGIDAGIYVNNGAENSTAESILETTKTQKLMNFLATHATNNYVAFGSLGAGEIVWLDDLSLKQLVQGTLYAIRDVGETDQDVTGIYGSFIGGSQIGVVANVAGDFSAGILASISRYNKILLRKWVGTTWTTLINTTQVPSNSVLPEIKTHRSGADLLVDLYYGGVQVGTQKTISNAEIINNTYIGIFSTYSGNSIDSFIGTSYKSEE